MRHHPTRARRLRFNAELEIEEGLQWKAGPWRGRGQGPDRLGQLADGQGKSLARFAHQQSCLPLVTEEGWHKKTLSLHPMTIPLQRLMEAMVPSIGTQLCTSPQICPAVGGAAGASQHTTKSSPGGLALAGAAISASGSRIMLRNNSVRNLIANLLWTKLAGVCAVCLCSADSRFS